MVRAVRRGVSVVRRAVVGVGVLHALLAVWHVCFLVVAVALPVVIIRVCGWIRHRRKRRSTDGRKGD